MIKLLRVVSVVTIGCSLLWMWTIIALPVPAPDMNPDPLTPTIQPGGFSVDDRPITDTLEDQANTPFTNLPTGVAKRIDFVVDEATWERLTDRERADQLRDWILFAVVSDAGLTAEEINRVLFDVPETRHAHMNSLANFEYGVTRTCFIGDGRAVAIIPQCNSEERKDYLAHIGDEHRKTLGEIPERILVFEYEIEAGDLSAAITRRDDVKGQQVFTPEYGYHEATIRNLSEFTAFLSRIQDVTFARLDRSAITLGGRRLAAREYRGIRVEDVAAVWQAQNKLTTYRERILARQKRESEQLHEEWQQKLDTLNRQRRSRVFPQYGRNRVFNDDSSSGSRDPLTDEIDIDEVQRRILQGESYADILEDMKNNAESDVIRPLDDSDYERKATQIQIGYDQAAKRLNEKHAQEYIGQKLFQDHTGFSLDPTYDYEGMLAFVVGLDRELQALRAGTLSGLSSDALAQVEKSLRANDKDPFWKLLMQLGESEQLVPNVVGEVLGQEVGNYLRAGEMKKEVASEFLARVISEIEELEAGEGVAAWIERIEETAADLAEGNAVELDALQNEITRDKSFLAEMLSESLKRVVANHRIAGSYRWDDLSVLLDTVENELQTLPVSLSEWEGVHSDLLDEDASSYLEFKKKLQSQDGILARAIHRRLADSEQWYKGSDEFDELGLAWSIGRRVDELREMVEKAEADGLVDFISRLRDAAREEDGERFEVELDSFVATDNSLVTVITAEIISAVKEHQILHTDELATDLKALATACRNLTSDEEDVVNLASLHKARESLKDGDDGPTEELLQEYQNKIRELPSGVSQVTPEGIPAKQFLILFLRKSFEFSVDDNQGLVQRLELVEKTLQDWAQEVAKEDLPKVRLALQQGDKNREVPFLVFVDKLKNRVPEGVAEIDLKLLLHLAARLDREGNRAFRFQKSRYDGDLKGTEIGMVLFYTDLLAKLWESVGYDAPKIEVDGFRSAPDGGVPPIYKQQTVEHPSTRLWFGPEDSAFQMHSDRRGVILARNVARIFSASSNPLNPGVEVPTTFESERTMGWWNNHYEEVAAYEQEYERLNEYIKWSVIIGWLEASNHSRLLGFLADVAVDRTSWFPDWVKAHPELRYKNWERVGFFERGYKGTETEAMPILKSRPFANFGEPQKAWTISGGVSGARPSELVKRFTLPPPRSISGRSKLSMRGVKTDSLSMSANSIETIRGTKHSFNVTSPRTAAMQVTPKPSQTLRSRYVEIANTKVDRSITRSGNELAFNTTAGQAQLGSLNIKPTQNGFSVGLRSRDLDLGQSLARDVSRSGKTTEVALSADARVDTLIVARDQSYYVKMHGSEKWLKMAPEGAPSGKLKEGWQARVSDTSVGSERYNLAWVEGKSVTPELGRGEYVRIELPVLRDQRPVIRTDARGPPPEGTRLAEFSSGNHKFNGQIDADGTAVWISSRDLPQSIKRSPSSLTKIIDSADLGNIRNQLKAGQPVEFRRPIDPGKPSLIGHLEAGNQAEAASILARDPSGAQRVLKTDLAERVAVIDRYLDQGRPTEALRRLETATAVHREHPDLLLRRGLAQMQRGRADAAADALNMVVTRKSDTQSWFNEVNRRLPRSKAGSGERRFLVASARKTASRDLAAKGIDLPLEFQPNGSKGVDTVANLSGRPEFRVAKPSDVPANARIYLDDAAGLNARDFSPAARQRTLTQAIDAGQAELYVMYAPDPVMKLNPDVVKFGKTKTSTSFRQVSAPQYYFERAPRIHYHAPTGDDEEDEWDYCEKELSEPSSNTDGASRACHDYPIFFLQKPSNRE